jgi:hypothetical protein
MSGEAGQQIIELRQLHLKPALARPGARREEIEDELGAVEDFGAEPVFEVSLLSGSQVAVEQDGVGCGGFDRSFDFGDFAGADESGGFGSVADLEDAVYDLGAGAGSKLRQFLQGLLGGPGGLRTRAATPAYLDADQNGLFTRPCDRSRDLRLRSLAVSSRHLLSRGGAGRRSVVSGAGMSVRALGGDDRRNGVLEDQLLLVICFEHEGVLVKALDPARELDSAQQIDRDDPLFLARVVQKPILYVLRRLIHKNLAPALPPAKTPPEKVVGVIQLYTH